MKYVSKGSLFDVEIAQEDGHIETLNGTIPYKKGHVITTDFYGNKQVILKHILDEAFVQVEVKEKPRPDMQLSSFAEQYMNAYASYTGAELNQEEDQDYINKTRELIKDKAF